MMLVSIGLLLSDQTIVPWICIREASFLNIPRSAAHKLTHIFCFSNIDENKKKLELEFKPQIEEREQLRAKFEL
jgi:hypothetical protein